MKTFTALLALCAGKSLVPVNSPHKGQWRGTLMFSLIYAWINGWVNNREAGDLRRYRGHYDIIVMICQHWASGNWLIPCGAFDVGAYIIHQKACTHFCCVAFGRGYSVSAYILSWWRHQVETFSALLALCHRCISLTKTSNAELWCFVWCAPKQTTGQAIEMLLIWDANALIMTLCNGSYPWCTCVYSSV